MSKKTLLLYTLIASFVITSLGAGILIIFQKKYLVEINDTPYDYNEYYYAVKKYSSKIDPETSTREAIQKNLDGILEATINKYSLIEHAKENGLNPSKEQVLSYIKQEFVDENGKYSKEKFLSFLKNSHITEEKLVNNISMSIVTDVISQIYKRILDNISIPNFDEVVDLANVNVSYSLSNETSTEEVLKKYKNVSDSDILKQYSSDILKGRFLSEPTFDFDYCIIDKNSIFKNQPITEKEIKVNFDKFKNNNIKFNLVQIITDDKVKAKMAKRELDLGASWHDVWDKYSTEKDTKDGDYGEFTRGDLGDDIFLTVKQMNDGDKPYSSVFKSELGYHIFKKTKNVRLPITPSEKAKIIDNIKRHIMKEKGEQALAILTDKYHSEGIKSLSDNGYEVLRNNNVDISNILKIHPRLVQFYRDIDWNSDRGVAENKKDILFYSISNKQKGEILPLDKVKGVVVYELIHKLPVPGDMVTNLKWHKEKENLIESNSSTFLKKSILDTIIAGDNQNYHVAYDEKNNKFYFFLVETYTKNNDNASTKKLKREVHDKVRSFIGSRMFNILKSSQDIEINYPLVKKINNDIIESSMLKK